MRKIVLAASAVALIAASSVALANHEGGGGPNWIFQFDANHDDAISLEEFNAAHAAVFARMDANHDQRLTREELAAQHGP